MLIYSDDSQKTPLRRDTGIRSLLVNIDESGRVSAEVYENGRMTDLYSRPTLGEMLACINGFFATGKLQLVSGGSSPISLHVPDLASQTASGQSSTS